MNKIAVVLILLLSSVLLAETQEEVYYQALKAEEAGDVSGSLSLFERAIDIGGEYTDEIREIVNEYYDALGISRDGSSVSFRLQGDVGGYALRYDDFSASDSSARYGGDAYLTLNAFLDWNVGDWIHSFGLSFAMDRIFADNVPVLDTCTWMLVPGIEYSLVGESLMLDVGMEYNIYDMDKFEPAAFLWFEFDAKRFEKQRIGAAIWGYTRWGGNTTAAVYATWHRTVPLGLNGQVYAGVKYEADSLADVIGYVDKLSEDCERTEFGMCVDGSMPPGTMPPFTDFWGECVRDHGEEVCADSRNGILQSYMDAAYADWLEQMAQAETSDVEMEYRMSRWIGPTVRSKISYRFRNRLSLESKMNLLYAFLVDGASSEYEKMRKFSVSWGLSLGWNPNIFTFYVGFEQLYLHYWLPNSLKNYFPDNSLVNEVKLGVKFDI